MRLIIHAPGVRVGGGKTLLEALLREMTMECVALLDERLIADRPALAQSVAVHPIGRHGFARLAAEWSLRNIAADDDVVLCFASLPPLFRCRGRVFVFLQNRYLIENGSLAGLPPRMQMKIRLDRAWLRARARNARAVIVQTGSMARAASAVLGTDVLVMPFRRSRDPGAPLHDGRQVDDNDPARFLYVASGEPHKNHRKLILAWSILASDGLKPRLVITLERAANPALYDWICACRTDFGLAVEFDTPPKGESLARLYATADALIYPSLMESFGLPLLEAAEAGIPILAAERDYVRDVVSPAESFDPDSEVSIARAVRRFLGRPEPEAPIATPAQFLSRLLEL
ncbi:MAG: glycosyltransferase [Betaproteobacteria bacterium]|nr:glycosyltransferase [Betaproteobacteria bacterium]